MYNLLVTIAEDAWELPAYEYDRTRFLEYTTDSLKAEFGKLDAAAIEKLKSLPTLFTYEGDEEVVRVGDLLPRTGQIQTGESDRFGVTANCLAKSAGGVSASAEWGRK